MNLFVIGAGFTKAVFPQAPLNPELLKVLSTNGYGSAPQKLINRYKTDDIEIALTKLDADFASANSRNQRKRIQGLRQCLERDLVRYFLNYRASEKLLETTPWLKKLLDKGIHRGASASNVGCRRVFS